MNTNINDVTIGLIAMQVGNTIYREGSEDSRIVEAAEVICIAASSGSVKYEQNDYGCEALWLYKTKHGAFEVVTDLATGLTSRITKIADGKQNVCYTIYQVKDGDEFRDLRFNAYNNVTRKGGKVILENYNSVYTDTVAGEVLDLGKLHVKFNTNHPGDYTGRSMSVSDVIVCTTNGATKAYYVDTTGFKEIDFLAFALPQKDYLSATMIKAIAAAAADGIHGDFWGEDSYIVDKYAEATGGEQLDCEGITVSIASSEDEVEVIIGDETYVVKVMKKG